MTAEGTHRCPGPGCDETVPDDRFACRTHWIRLSAKTRGHITGTARLTTLHPRRRDAIAAARAEWAAS